MNNGNKLEKFYVSTLAILKAEGKALALHKNKISDGTPCNLWTLPGGKMDQDETEFQTLKRELKEEIDIDLSDEPIRFGGYHFGGSFKDGTKLFLLHFIIELDKTFIPKLSDEHDQFEWMKYDDFLNTPFHLQRVLLKDILKYNK